MKFGTTPLHVMAFAVCLASAAQAAPSEGGAAPLSQKASRGLQLAKGSPASKAFGNPFKAPSDTMIDLEPTGSISTSGKTPPAADDKSAAPSEAAPAAKKRH